MKKLLIAAAIVCAAGVVQAATVTWSFGMINGYGNGGKGWSDAGLTGNVTAQLIIGSSLTDGVIGGTVYDASSMIAFEDGYAYPDALEISGMANDTLYYSQLILKKGDSTLTSGIFEIAASSLEDGVTYPNWAMGSDSVYLNDATTGSLTGLSTFNTVGGAFANAGWQNVPEPTSGLLLLIGVAGLALRRRRA